MATKQFSSRVINKHDTEANWNLTSGFIPYAGETIVYDVDANHTLPRVKIGDGVTDVKLLPFVDAIVSVNNKTGTVTLDKSDVGLSNVDNVRQYSSSNPPPYPVTSVNTKTGAVTLTASDVSADPSGSASTVQGNLDTHTGNTTIHVTSQNKTDWNAKYDKPSGGIPKTDLASDVQTSLGKADTALQSAHEVPSGGTTGQVLAKTSGTDYDAEWKTLTASDVGALPSNTAIHNVPSGGTQGQVLTKSSSTDYDATWTDVPAGTEIIKYDGNPGDITCDHTFQEVFDIVSAQKPFIVFCNQSQFQLFDYTATFVAFESSFVDTGLLATGRCKLTHAAEFNTISFEYDAVAGVPSASSASDGDVLTADGQGRYGWEPLSSGGDSIYDVAFVYDSSNDSISVATGNFNEVLVARLDDAKTISALFVSGLLDLQYACQSTEMFLSGTMLAPVINIVFIQNNTRILLSWSYDSQNDEDIIVKTETPLGGGGVIKTSITTTTSWTDNYDGTYSQVLAFPQGVTLTNDSKVDIQPNLAALAQFSADSVSGAFVVNNNGTATMMLIGAPLSSAVTMQVTITETTAI